MKSVIAAPLSPGLPDEGEEQAREADHRGQAAQGAEIDVGDHDQVHEHHDVADRERDETECAPEQQADAVAPVRTDQQETRRSRWSARKARRRLQPSDPPFLKRNASAKLRTASLGREKIAAITAERRSR